MLAVPNPLLAPATLCHARPPPHAPMHCVHAGSGVGPTLADYDLHKIHQLLPCSFLMGNGTNPCGPTDASELTSETLIYNGA